MIDPAMFGNFADPVLLAGWLAGLLSVTAYSPYLRDILRGRARPDRACWLIWAVLATMSGASNVAGGAGASLVFIGVQVAGTLAVFVLSIRYGAGHYLSAQNVVILCLAAIGLGAWFYTTEPFWALSIAIGVSALGGANTIQKVYSTPESETPSMWVVSSIAAGLGVYAVGGTDPLLLAYPVYLLLLYTGIVLAQVLGARRIARKLTAEVVWYSRRAAASRTAMLAQGTPLPSHPARAMPPPITMPQVV